ncbi:SMI1/KNR4 family protein [Gorillibacterium timonense]|uniref:SMI1/KNR4 family protein n=1 Tax=Gorillibacterium timonense TaxID=1689269 RepID=UPI00071CDC19|nr:SMI1/KNR4 family protein [Gorillibacterium timonense]
MKRLLYIVLKMIASDRSFSHSDYRIPQNEFENFIKTVIHKGYIDVISLSPKKLVVSSLGHEFLQQHKQYESELPLGPDELPYWVSFEGEHDQQPRITEDQGIWESPNYFDWKNVFEKVLSYSKEISGESELHIADKATISELMKIESMLNTKLPGEFVDVLLNFSKKVTFFWSVTNPSYGCHLSDGGRLIEGGGLRDGGLWDLDALPTLNQERLDHIDMLEEHDESLHYWENSLIFAKDGSGDYFAIDLHYLPGEVIFLSHEDHFSRYSLGKNFGAFLDNWIRIGCSGYTVRDFQAFTGCDSPYIDHKSKNSITMRRWLSIEK